MEAPSALSVGLCLAHLATDKRPWLERLAVEAPLPMAGKPGGLYLDNASEFKSEALRRGCEQHGIGSRSYFDGGQLGGYTAGSLVRGSGKFWLNSLCHVRIQAFRSRLGR